MTLPIQQKPVFNTKLPSSGIKIEYYPFSVKELKSLLIAQETESVEDIVSTIKTIITSCIKTKIDYDKLTPFDIEYLFIKIRAKSVGEILEFIIRCDACNSPTAKQPVTINLDDVIIEKTDKHAQKFDLFDSVGISMKYPDMAQLEELNNIDLTNLSGSVTDKLIEISAECIDYIYDAEQMYSSKDHSKDELIKFIEQLNSEQFSKIRNFFETMPECRIYVDFVCKECGATHKKYLNGISTFF